MAVEYIGDISRRERGERKIPYLLIFRRNQD